MNQHKAMYQSTVQHRGEEWAKIIRQRMSLALSSRRQRFVDNLRHLHDTDADKSDEDSYLLEERKKLLSCLLAESETEQTDLNVLLQIQDKVLHELSDDINNCLTQPCTQDESLVCPVCGVGTLSLSGTLLSCHCGIRIDTQTDSVSLDAIARSLQIARESHCISGCSHPIRGWIMHQNVSDVHLPYPDGMNTRGPRQRGNSAEQDDQVSLLCVGCDMCNFLEIVV